MAEADGGGVALGLAEAAGNSVRVGAADGAVGDLDLNVLGAHFAQREIAEIDQTAGLGIGVLHIADADAA